MTGISKISKLLFVKILFVIYFFRENSNYMMKKMSLETKNLIEL